MVVAPDLHLYRTDFAQVGTTGRGCMKVVPTEERLKAKGNLDRIVIGGENGSVICVQRKNNDTQIVYKTPPGPPIAAVCLGGAAGTLHDKVFVVADNAVRGINKKGKHFFSFETNMAEPARRMFIWGVELVVTGKKSYNHYHDCQDTDFILSSDEILDVVCLQEGGAWASRPFTAVLACSDATLKVIEKSSLAYSDVPYTVTLHMNDGGPTRQFVTYGTKTGRIGLVNIAPSEATDQSRGIIWEINTSNISGVSTMCYYPFMDSQRQDLIIGKENGMVEIYSIAEDDTAILVGVFNADESITSVSCGKVSTKSYDEIIVCTCTGWVFSLCKTAIMTQSATTSSNVNVKVQQLRSEIEELETKVNEERHRYTEMTLRDGSTAAYIPHFQVHESFDFSPTYGCYTLIVELVLPIDYVIVKSNLPVKLIEVEKNFSVVSRIPQSELSPYALLASYRCQAKTSRLELRVRISEGYSGPLHVYVCPNVHPRAGVIRTFDVKPLCAHVRIHEVDRSRPFNTLAFSGSFSLAEVHAWMVQLLIGIPPKSGADDMATLCFEGTVDGGTQLQATFSRGSAIFKSDSISTIAIIRDIITSDTTKRDMRVDVVCDVNEASIPYCLRLLDQRMKQLIGMDKRKMMAAALKTTERLQELEVNNNGDISFLSEENRKILAEHDQIFSDGEDESLDENDILAVYEGLLIDRGRLAGKNVQNRVPALKQLLLEDYSLDAALSFFKTTAEDAYFH